MNRKIIFLDIDGTLVNYHNVIPDSAQEAVKRARANGHYVFICTGRAPSQLAGPVAEIELDGKICLAGGYVEVRGQVISENYMSREDVAFIIRYLRSKRICYCLESPSGVFAEGRSKAYFSEIVKGIILKYPDKKEEITAGMKVFIDTMIEGIEMIRDDVVKVSFFGSETAFEEIQNSLKERFNVLPNTVKMGEKDGGEIMMPGIHKAVAIKRVLEHLKIRREDSLAYGDGYNDREMIEFVGNGIAMGNACEELKKAANDVTDSVEADGLYKSFEKYQLI